VKYTDPPVPRARLHMSDGSQLTIPVVDLNEFATLTEALAAHKAWRGKYAVLPTPGSKGPRVVAAHYQEGTT
jgi:hypothetical protein